MGPFLRSLCATEDYSISSAISSSSNPLAISASLNFSSALRSMLRACAVEIPSCSATSFNVQKYSICIDLSHSSLCRVCCAYFVWPWLGISANGRPDQSVYGNAYQFNLRSLYSNTTYWLVGSGSHSLCPVDFDQPPSN